MEDFTKPSADEAVTQKMIDNVKMASNLENERLLEQLYEQFLEEGFSPEVAAEKAREEFNRRDFAGAMGGRVLKQTGGITETRTLPPEYIEAAQKTFLADLTRQAGLPSVTTATTQQPGETAEQFAARQAQAQQFGITRAGMAELAPQFSS